MLRNRKLWKSVLLSSYKRLKIHFEQIKQILINATEVLVVAKNQIIV